LYCINDLMIGYMKRIFVFLIGLMTVCAMHAQVVAQDEPALVYYSPKTAVILDFSYTVEKQEPGIYTAYAESMLGATDIVKEAKTTYTIQDVRIGTTTTTDYTRPHKVVAEPGFPLLLSLNEKNLLVGYNLPPNDDRKAPKNSPKSTCSHPKNASASLTVPYPEEVLKATTPSARAHAIVKQIMHIRETRMYLLSGEVEHAPADGQAMKQVLDELGKQEAQLTALFIGKKSSRTEHKHVQFEPGNEPQRWYFSEENGFTDAENIDAQMIEAKVSLHAQQLTAAPAVEDKKKKKEPVTVNSQLVYNLPGTGEVKVQYNGETLAERTIQIAQLGVDVPLAKDLFTGETLPVIVVSEKTGNIVSISK